MLGQEMHLPAGSTGRPRRTAWPVLDFRHPELQPDAIVRRLSIGALRVVEIARALVADAQVLVFDEPTSSLTGADVQRLFQVIRKLQADGRGVVYISHFLEEVREICNRYSVLRDGQTVGSGDLAEVDEAGIVALMVGRQVADLFPALPHQPGQRSSRCKPFRAADAQRRVVPNCRGEILGWPGSSVRDEPKRCGPSSGSTRFAGQVRVAGLTRSGAPAEMIRAGLGFLSEDRKGEGLAQSRSIADNLTYSRLQPYVRFGWLRLEQRSQSVRQWMQKLNIKARSPEQEVQQLRQSAEGGPGSCCIRRPRFCFWTNRRGASTSARGRDLPADRRGGGDRQGGNLRQFVPAGIAGGLRSGGSDVAGQATRNPPRKGLDGRSGDVLRRGVMRAYIQSVYMAKQ